jgi:hypothetical protein
MSYKSRFSCLACAAVLILATAQGASAQTAGIAGVVTFEGQPVARAVVSLSGNNLRIKVETDRAGRFTFAALPVGTYEIAVSTAAGSGGVRVDLGSSDIAVTIGLSPLREIAQSSTNVGGPVARRSGTDVVLNGEALARSPAAGNLSEILLQVPGAARGANGVVHINGDHADIAYVVNGVAVPQALNRVIGNEIEPANVAFAEVLEGAYPAQFGEKFAAVVNLATRAGNGAAGYDLDLSGGSFGRFDSTLAYHAPLGKGAFAFALRNERDGRAIDLPDPASPHGAGSDSNQYLRFSLPRGGDVIDATFSRSFQTYQIPPDVANGAPFTQDDNEKQTDTFGSIQYRHAIGGHGSLSFGPSLKVSRIDDSPDFANDIAFGVANGTADCTADLATCSNSVLADRTSTDYRFSADYALRSDRHEVRAGGVFDVTTVTKLYQVTLQPKNPFSTAPFLVTDAAPNLGHTFEAYLQDSWKFGATWALDYGLRYDTFQLGSSEFRTGSGQFSPRIKVTRIFSPSASAYAYYGRFFTPYSFENVSPSAAAQIVPNSGSFDLLPQRDSVIELGGHVPLGGGDLGLRVMAKNAADLIDDTQVGFTNLHQDINYRAGRIATQSMVYQTPLVRAGRVYFSATHTYAVVKDCETQLLAPCFSGPALDWIPADHDQRWDLNGGFLLDDRRSGWFSASAEYGSGLTSAVCEPLNDNCKVPPHLTFDAEKGFSLGPGCALALRVRNLLNDTYRVTYLNAQGNHYARPRTIEANLHFSGR